MGKVLAVFPGSDGHLWVVKVKVAVKEYTQPILNISQLEFDEHYYIKEGRMDRRSLKWYVGHSRNYYTENGLINSYENELLQWATT